MNEFDRRLMARAQTIRPQPNRVEQWAQRPHRGRDWIVRAACVGWWLLTTSIIPPTAPLLLILMWWALMFGGAMMIWKGYKHLTRPTYQHGTPADPTPLPERYRLADALHWQGWVLAGPTVTDVVEAAERDAVAEWEGRLQSRPLEQAWDEYSRTLAQWAQDKVQ